jgi:protein-S-isoprenylcysteine O-methyltransferase Ste14
VSAMRALQAWTLRRWVAAAAAAVGSFVLLGIPTAMIPNPVFARRIEAPAWTSPSLVLTAVLAGLLLATYVRATGRAAEDGERFDEASPEEARSFTVGGLLAFFAIGCPTCNKLVLVALGSSGAITWFEPVQPVLALAGIVVLVWALHRRLTSEVVCRLPAGRDRMPV